jgi:hypothetical protein
MFRKSIIAATIIAILIGSIGLPVTAHACRMMKRVTSVACGNCGAEHAAARAPDRDNSRPRIAATPCCSTTNTVQAISSAITIQNREMVAVIVAMFVSYHPYRREPVCNGYIAHKGFRPPIARQGQHTYLFNSLFLI